MATDRGYAWGRDRSNFARKKAKNLNLEIAPPGGQLAMQSLWRELMERAKNAAIAAATSVFSHFLATANKVNMIVLCSTILLPSKMGFS